MAEAAPIAVGGKLAENVVHFAQFLRRAGVTIGSGQVLDAIDAMAAVGIARRDDVYTALHAVFVSKREQDELFALGFETFWRDPFGPNQALALLLPPSKMDGTNKGKKLPRRLQDAWQGPGNRSRPGEPEHKPPEVEIDMRGTASDREILKQRDFEDLTAEEEARIRRIFAQMRFPWRDRPTRRLRPSSRGTRIDLRSTLRGSMRTLGEPIQVQRVSRRTRPPPIVVLCDISGSMEKYSRILLCFLHALTNDRDRVHTFVFGTRLTNITRSLKHRDVDVAFDELTAAVRDWSGGTRIGASLAAFHRDWARRVLGQGAIVLLITDGLERDEPDELAAIAERLRLSCRRLIWLNPLLRYEGFEPKAAGVRALLPHVDEHRAVHNLQSLEDLAAALAD